IVHGEITPDDDGIAGPDADAPAEGELVYGFIDRRAPGITVSDQWDVLGMRASQSRATILDHVPMRPDRVSRIIPAGRHPDLLTFAITSNFQLLIAAVYAGVAAR
ncbi:acyl-CoA dehydrogenase, partial [Burkholderia multivorans]